MGNVSLCEYRATIGSAGVFYSAYKEWCWHNSLNPDLGHFLSMVKRDDYKFMTYYGMLI